MKKLFTLLAFVWSLSAFSQSADGLFKTVTASGTNTYTISDPNPNAVNYDSKEKWIVTFTNASTGNVTLNRATIGAKAVRDSEGTQLASGDILAGQRLLLSYNGTYYQVIGGTGSGSVEDGDKGDVTVSADGATWTIDAGAVTGSKIESSVTLAGNPTTTTQSAGNNSTRIATTAYADALVAQTITNGVTTSAPSQNEVFDAMALKAERQREFGLACSDLATDLTTGDVKAYFRIPRAFTVTSVRASVGTAQGSGTALTIRIEENGTTILSTLITIDNGEKTSQTAAAPVISDPSLADDSEITIDIVTAGTGGKGLIVWIIGY